MVLQLAAVRPGTVRQSIAGMAERGAKGTRVCVAFPAIPAIALNVSCFCKR